MRQRGPIPDSDWRDGFLFVGNHLALDFLNTRPVQNGEPMELLFDFSALLRWFRAAGLLSSPQVTNLQRQSERKAAQRTPEGMREFREKLRNEILAWEDGADLHRTTVAELNRLLAAHPMLGKLQPTGNAPPNGIGIVVRTAPTRRLVCPIGTQRREVVRGSGSEPHSQVWTMRSAFL